MKNAWLVRAVVAALFLALVGWIIANTSWIEEEVDDPIKGAAAADPYYSLRAILKASGSKLESRGKLEPLPPDGATLVLDSLFWDLFPERDALLKAWVERGGHLVLGSGQLGDEQRLRWIPIVPLDARRAAASAASAASAAEDAGDEDEDGDTVARPVAPARAASLPQPGRAAGLPCVEEYVEAPQSVPAFEPGRHYVGCLFSIDLRPRRGVEPAWQLLDQGRSIALRVPVGRGDVTAIASWRAPPGMFTRFRDSSRQLHDNRALMFHDTGLIISAILGARPGRDVWIVDDEAGEPFGKWLWHHGRAPLLLGLAAVALALWRLMVRFGPREAPAVRARRSMGEQVRGTGEFIAATDPAALHSATRRAFDDAARTRIEDWATLDDPERVDALARRLGDAVALDRQALLAALNAAPRPHAAQWLAAIATIEEARRALLRARPPETT